MTCSKRTRHTFSSSSLEKNQILKMYNRLFQYSFSPSIEVENDISIYLTANRFNVRKWITSLMNMGLSCTIYIDSVMKNQWWIQREAKGTLAPSFKRERERERGFLNP